MSWENETGSFALGDFAVEKGGVIREARLAWQRFGTLNDKRDNLILYPSSYSARLADMSWLIGPEGILDPTRWCIIAVGMFSNGESSGAAERPDYPALVTVANRTVDKAHALARRFAPHGRVRSGGYEDFAGESFDIVINATSASLSGALPPVSAGALARSSSTSTSR